MLEEYTVVYVLLGVEAFFFASWKLQKAQIIPTNFQSTANPT